MRTAAKSGLTSQTLMNGLAGVGLLVYLPGLLLGLLLTLVMYVAVSRLNKRDSER